MVVCGVEHASLGTRYIGVVCCWTVGLLLIFGRVYVPHDLSGFESRIYSSTSDVRILEVYVYDGYVPGIIWMQVIRGGIPQLASTVPLRTLVLLSLIHI